MLLGPAAIDRNNPLGFWGRLTPAQKLSLAGIAGLMIVVVGVFFAAARGPEYAPAFTNLKDEDAAAIVAKLKENKIPYELAERGTIKVPPGQVQEVRLLMVGQGVTAASQGVGFELFSQPHIGMTEFAEKINYQRALEGELARTIMRLDAVESARVHVVVPQPSLFSSQQKETTASVVVQLKPGRRLDPSQVQGITMLIAGSIEGLKPPAITIMDSAGNVLSDRNGPHEPFKQTGSRLDVQRALESRLEEEIRTMIGRVLGPDRVVVRVSSDLDWDQYESASETFSPDQKPAQVRSQRQVAETQSSTGAATGGVPGTQANVPTYQGRQGAGGNSTAERQEVNTNYELSKTVEKLVRAPGGIKRLSVAIALDSEAIADPAQADAISRLVAAAAGINVARGDVVTLSSLPFTSLTKKDSEDLEAVKQREQMLTLARLAAMVLGPLLVVLVVWLTLRRGRKPEPAPATGLVAGADGKLTLSNAPIPDAVQVAEAINALPEPTPEEKEQMRVHQELVALAHREPLTIAQVVRAWLAEDRKAG